MTPRSLLLVSCLSSTRTACRVESGILLPGVGRCLMNCATAVENGGRRNGEHGSGKLGRIGDSAGMGPGDQAGRAFRMGPVRCRGRGGCGAGGRRRGRIGVYPAPTRGFPGDLSFCRLLGPAGVLELGAVPAGDGAALFLGALGVMLSAELKKEASVVTIPRSPHKLPQPPQILADDLSSEIGVCCFVCWLPSFSPIRKERVKRN